MLLLSVKSDPILRIKVSSASYADMALNILFPLQLRVQAQGRAYPLEFLQTCLGLMCWSASRYIFESMAAFLSYQSAGQGHRMIEHPGLIDSPHCT